MLLRKTSIKMQILFKGLTFSYLERFPKQKALFPKFVQNNIFLN